ncbi:MAG TPA: phosphatidate cytidylyltransferase [Hyphomicrobiaceae bacterium]|nr:phosphatidate cytidylyltransferase [Hyphomicrobiaceae bacterium]
MSENDDAGDDAEPVDLAARLGSDFGPRVISGLAMGAVVALFTFSGVTAFSVLVVIVALLLSWEWGRLVHGREADVVIAIHVGSAGAAAVLAAFGYVGLGLLALPIGAILAMLLSLGRNSLFSALGVFYAGLPAVALIWLRSDASLGMLAIIFVIVIVITSDTAGFLFGRVLGGPRLWPRLSPNKTWAGVIGALVASSIIGALFWFAVPGASAVRLAATGVVLSLAAQGGDLAESAIKRHFGAKDSGSLIPGHGGVMDRVDGLVAAAAVVGLATFVINVHSPAHALLIGP